MVLTVGSRVHVALIWHWNRHLRSTKTGGEGLEVILFPVDRQWAHPLSLPHSLSHSLSHSLPLFQPLLWNVLECRTCPLLTVWALVLQGCRYRYFGFKNFSMKRAWSPLSLPGFAPILFLSIELLLLIWGTTSSLCLGISMRKDMSLEFSTISLWFGSFSISDTSNDLKISFDGSETFKQPTYLASRLWAWTKSSCSRLLLLTWSICFDTYPNQASNSWSSGGL